MVFCGCGKIMRHNIVESGWAAMEKKDYTTSKRISAGIDQNSRLAKSYRAEGIAHYSEKGLSGGDCCFSRSIMDDPDKEFKKDVQFYLAQARMIIAR